MQPLCSKNAVSFPANPDFWRIAITVCTSHPCYVVSQCSYTTRTLNNDSCTSEDHTLSVTIRTTWLPSNKSLCVARYVCLSFWSCFSISLFAARRLRSSSFSFPPFALKHPISAIVLRIQGESDDRNCWRILLYADRRNSNCRMFTFKSSAFTCATIIRHLHAFDCPH